MRYLPVVLLGLPMFLGCGGKKPVSVVEARGKLMLQRKDGTRIPMTGAKVVFVPGNDGPHVTSLPAAIVEEDGSFQLGTFGKDDGVAEGDYIVTIDWKERIKPKHDVFGKGTVTRGPDRLGGVYSDRASSPLRARVEAGKDLLLTIQAP